MRFCFYMSFMPVCIQLFAKTEEQMKNLLAL